ncbi:hypothetical protein [Streptomyces sp. NPDC090021]
MADLTPQVRRAAALVRSGRTAQAQRLLPTQRVYPTPGSLEAHLFPTR